MRNARLDESQIRIKIARRNINNFRYAGASPVAQRVKCPPPMREAWVRYLGQEDRLEKEMAAHSSPLAWKIPWTEKPGGLRSTGSHRAGHDRATSLHFQICSCCHSNGRNQRGTKEPLHEDERGEWKSWLKTQRSKTKITASSPIISRQIYGVKVETGTKFIFLGSKILVGGDCSHEIQRHLLIERKAKTT